MALWSPKGGWRYLISEVSLCEVSLYRSYLPGCRVLADTINRNDLPHASTPTGLTPFAFIQNTLRRPSRHTITPLHALPAAYQTFNLNPYTLKQGACPAYEG